MKYETVGEGASGVPHEKGMQQSDDCLLTAEQIEFVLDYICFLMVHSMKENARWLSVVERALEESRKEDPHARALARMMAKRGRAA